MSDLADRTPEAWVADLLHGTAEAQAAAVEALEQLGAAAGSALCTALAELQSETQGLRWRLSNLGPFQASAPAAMRGEEARVRREIAVNEERVERLVRVLHAIRAHEAIHPLLEALQRSHSREAHLLARALAPVGAPAIPQLGEALESRLLWVAVSAAEALTTIGGPEVAELLVHRLQTASHDLLRVCLIRCLGRLGDPVAVEVLSGFLTSGTRDERLYATEALGHIGDPRGLDPILRCLAADGSYSSDLTLQAAALRALGSLPDPRAVAPLVRVLEDSRSPLHAAALAALEQLAERCPTVELRRALPALRASARRAQPERESVMRARAALADRIEALTDGLKSLPIPAPGSALDPDQLPRPVEGFAPVAELLPIPDPVAVEPSRTGEKRTRAGWMRRGRSRS